MAASAIPSGGLIDPNKQAEYPIILGDKLAGKKDASRSKFVHIQYNHKSKSTNPLQRSVIKPSRVKDQYNLTITDRVQNSENVLNSSYKGSVDPEHAVSGPEEHNLILVFDAERKAFVLEPVATQLNFNLRSGPAKTSKQALELRQLRTLQEDDHGSGDDTSGVDDGPADESNPYDFRHFLPKDNADEDNKSVSDNATPEPYSAPSKGNTPLLMPTAKKPTASPNLKPSPNPKPLPKPQTNPLRQTKRPTAAAKPDTAAKPNPKPKPRVPEKAKQQDGPEVEAPKSSTPPDFGTGAISAHKAVPSPGSNIIVDGNLIIDMGSPPPSRPRFNINPAHFSSNNTPGMNVADDDEDDDEEIEDLRLPSPAGHEGRPAAPERLQPVSHAPVTEEEVEDDDALAAEMEAAFEESAREEEEARSQASQQGTLSHQYHVPSDDESEVSEEE
ncbi:hypothetical protein P170DRAFT_434744 [Aspergillus steynii IBT 23096]|uniref:Transcription elongation factor Eaf N-terminal domain-containing protein n=1 Tax=Aspergillus steynii IBT 23096 TaxID=1392250 RepID=A0A2I2GJG2_9EURO|nr:uncharacterized protein P170DRAFT_434744 [Aspergillus steynii IBT 23096]PLB53021.1 hypothetical protein P170DRAFT_434744 [Aspergillus steynii IBT 23096]